MSDYDWRRFDEIPVEVAFADKYGRLYTKLGPGWSREHSWSDCSGYWHWDFDTSREYFDADEDELEDIDVWDAWPYYAVSVQPRLLDD